MNNTNIGGSAFPAHGFTGMTLRDYFAAQALQGAIAHGFFNAEKANQSYAEYLSSIAYIYADAMLKVREE